MNPIACQQKTVFFYSIQIAHKYSLARISRMAFGSSHQPLVRGAHGLDTCVDSCRRGGVRRTITELGIFPAQNVNAQITIFSLPKC